jgi:hypothetical protein
MKRNARERLFIDWGIGSEEWGMGLGEKILLLFLHSRFSTPLLHQQSAIENFITNNRMRTSASSENLNKQALDLPRLLRHATEVKVAV